MYRETQFFRYVYSRRKAFGDLNRADNRRRLVTEYLGSLRIRRPGIDVAGLESRLLGAANSYRSFLASILEDLAKSQGKPRCGEKTPQHAIFAETLCEWFPGAAIIHLVRDPREVVASLQRVPWASNSVVTNARIWVRYNLAARQSRHRPEYLMVCYQDLVVRPEQELLRICTHLNEQYSPFYADTRRRESCLPIVVPAIELKHHGDRTQRILCPCLRGQGVGPTTVFVSVPTPS